MEIEILIDKIPTKIILIQEIYKEILEVYQGNKAEIIRGLIVEINQDKTIDIMMTMDIIEIILDIILIGIIEEVIFIEKMEEDQKEIFQ